MKFHHLHHPVEVEAAAAVCEKPQHPPNVRCALTIHVLKGAYDKECCVSGIKLNFKDELDALPHQGWTCAKTLASHLNSKLKK